MDDTYQAGNELKKTAVTKAQNKKKKLAMVLGGIGAVAGTVATGGIGGIVVGGVAGGFIGHGVGK